MTMGVDGLCKVVVVQVLIFVSCVQCMSIVLNVHLGVQLDTCGYN